LIELALQSLLTTRGDVSSRALSIGAVLHDLKQRGRAPPSTDRLLAALRVMDEAAHGFDLDPASVEQAIRVGTEFLTELSQ
jgi:hypothetical protein